SNSHYFYTHNGAYLQFEIGPVPNAVNRWAVYGQTTGAGPLLLATGSDTNVTGRFRAQGAGGFLFETGSAGNTQFEVLHQASVVNFVTIRGAGSEGQPGIGSAGSDANVTLAFRAKGAAGHAFYSHGGTAMNFAVGGISSAVNYLLVT